MSASLVPLQATRPILAEDSCQGQHSFSLKHIASRALLVNALIENCLKHCRIVVHMMRILTH